MATAVHRGNTDGITCCGMSRATPGSHWTLPLGDNSLRIALVAVGATANKMMTKNGPTLLAN
jgi:hypothetical protein